MWRFVDNQKMPPKAKKSKVSSGEDPKQQKLSFEPAQARAGSGDSAAVTSSPTPSTSRSTVSVGLSHEEKGEGKKFQEKWKIEFPWLRLTESGAMKCVLCTNKKGSNIFAREGCKNFQRSALVRHQETDDHRASQRLAHETRGKQQAIDKLTPRTDYSSAKNVLVDTALFMTKEEIPDCKFQPLIEHMVSFFFRFRGEGEGGGLVL